MSETGAAWTDGAPPRVCLIGPKGCGKTIYRTYLHAKARTELPDYVRAMLGVTQADLPAQGEVRRPAGAGWDWFHEGDLGQREAAGEYLPVIEPTQHVTRHQLALPRKDGEPLQAGLAYDFPGAYWEVEGAKPFIIEALRAARLIVMMVPYWTLLPKSLRPRPSPLFRARRLRDGLAAEAVQREHDERDESLRNGTLKWLELLRTARDGAPAPATVLVVFTMLHREWRHDLRDDAPEAAAVMARVQAVRALVTRDLLNLQHRPQLPGRRLGAGRWPLFDELRRAAQDLTHAAELRRTLEELHDACALYVEELERVAREAGYDETETLGVIEALRGLEARLPWHAFRYGAMNVVSERHAKRRPLAQHPDADFAAPGSGSPGAASRTFQRYLRIERAAAMLPSLYLCGSLD